MKKYNLHKSLFCIIFLLAILFVGCQTEEKSDENIQEESKYLTVSKQEALNFIRHTQDSLKAIYRNSDEYVTPNFDDFQYDDLINSDESLAVIGAETYNKKGFSRILVTKINNETKASVFSIYPDEYHKPDALSGNIFIADMEGNFINGFLVRKGIIVGRYILKSENSTNVTYRNEPETAEEDIAWDVELEEFVVTAKQNPDRPITIVYVYQQSFSPGDEEEDIKWDYTGGGGGSGGEKPTDCKGGKVYDFYTKECGCPSGTKEGKDGNCEDTIETEDVSPCIQSVVDLLKGDALGDQPLVKALKDIFDKNEDVNIIVKEGVLESGFFGQFKMSEAPGYAGGVMFDGSITFNSMYTSHMTNDFALSILIHEFIHGYIEYNESLVTLEVISQEDFESLFNFYNTTKVEADHELMAMKYVDVIQNILQENNPELSDLEANVLAWGGLQRTEVYKELVLKNKAPDLIRIQNMAKMNSGENKLNPNSNQKPCTE